MSARALTITLCPELVALIARSANSPPNRARGTPPICRAPVGRYRSITSAVRMLAMFRIVTSMNLRVLVNVDVLLELLERVLRSVGEGI